MVMVTFVGGTLFGLAAGGAAPTHPDEFALIADSWELLHSEYVDTEHLDPSALAHGAISGMADAVGDTGHTYFLTPDEAALEAEAMSGAFGGIGVDFRVTGEPTTISSLVDGAPGQLAGLHVGDRIVEVDGQEAAGPDTEEVLDRIAGRPNTTVDLLVERPKQDGKLPFHITRAVIDRDATGWAMIPGSDLALVTLTDFPDGCTIELIKTVNEASEAGATGLVFDLRGNPGGYVQEAIGVAGVFLPAGEVALRERLADGTETVETVPSGVSPTGLPVVVLVDGDSASAAEIVAGALQDAKRATIVGTTTAGTGTILTDYTLADGSDLSVGTERWYTPLGRSAWHAGLTPDVVVEMPKGGASLTPGNLAGVNAKGLAKSKDAQLLRAIAVLEPD